MNAATVVQMQDRPDRPLVRKLRFIEHLTARRDLAPLELRVGIRLISLTNTKRGFAWPTVDQLAAELGAHRRNVIRAIRRLEQLGLFVVVQSTGRGHANEYEPAFEALPDGCAFVDARAERMAPAPPFQSPNAFGSDAERMAFSSQRVAFSSLKDGAGATPSSLPSDLYNNRSSTEALSAESAPREQGKPSSSSSASERPERSSPGASKKSQAEEDLRHIEGIQALWHDPLPPGTLNRVERSIKARFLARFSQSDRLRVVDQLEALAETHDAHNGGSIGGFARRLYWDAEAFLDHDEDGVPVWPPGHS